MNLVKKWLNMPQRQQSGQFLFLNKVYESKNRVTKQPKFTVSVIGTYHLQMAPRLLGSIHAYLVIQSQILQLITLI